MYTKVCNMNISCAILFAISCFSDLQSATQRLELTEFEVKFTSPAFVRPQLPFSWIIKAKVDQLIYQAKQQRNCHSRSTFSVRVKVK